MSSSEKAGHPRAPFAARDREFAQYRNAHPDVTFGQYRARQIYESIQRGRPHFSLGRHLTTTSDGPQDFWTAGAAKAAYYFRKMRLKPHHRVIDYGCGSLRIGAHFIKFLEPGRYLGLDVVPEFFEMGKDLVGQEIMESKRPHLLTIDSSSIAEGARFRADFVFSAAVCTHVHPDEIAMYFENLSQLTVKPGAQLHLNATVSDKPRRVLYDAWAWPLEFYRRSLPALELVRAPRGATRIEQGHPIWSADLIFRRSETGDTLRSRLASAVAELRLRSDPRTYGIPGKLAGLVRQKQR